MDKTVHMCVPLTVGHVIPLTAHVIVIRVGWDQTVT